MPRPTIGSRIRKTRKQRGKSAPPLKASMKRTAKRGRQAPGTPRTPRRSAPLSKAAQKSAADTKKRMGEMGDVRAKQTAARKKEATPKKTAPKSTAPALTQRVTPVAPYEEGYTFGQTPAAAPAVSPNPFTGSIYDDPGLDPYAAQASVGLDIPEIPTAPEPVIPGVSGPFLQTGPVTTQDYDVWGEDPVTPAPLWNPGDPGPTFDPGDLGQLERDYEFGNITPATPDVDIPGPGAAPGQMAPDPGYMPPPAEMDPAELEELSAQVRLRQLMANPALQNILPALRGVGLVK